MKNKARILFAIALLSGAALLTSNAHADTTEYVDVTVNVPVICSLSATNSHLTKTINPGTSDTVGIAKLKAFCNDANGFVIYTVGYTNDIYGNKYLTTDLGDEYKIDTGLSDSGDTSNWNMTIDNDASANNNYEAVIENSFDSAHVIPEAFTKVASLNTVTDHFVGTNLTIQVDAYAAPHQASGTYAGKIKFTIIHPAINSPEILYMQNVDNWKDRLETGQEVYAVDQRDNQGYTVAKLPDGKIWMTKNLRLNLETANITTENTNNPSEEFMEAINSETRPAPNNDERWCTGTGADCINTIQYDTTNIGDFGNIDSDGHAYDEYGVYYNWYTATAGNGGRGYIDANGDICPSGWHLPTGDVDGEIYNMVMAVVGYEPDTTQASYPAYSADASVALRNSAAKFLNSGTKLANTLLGRGSNGGFWSSMTAIPTQAIYLSITENGVSPGTNNGFLKYSGEAVRCVADDTPSED